MVLRHFLVYLPTAFFLVLVNTGFFSCSSDKIVSGTAPYTGPPLPGPMPPPGTPNLILEGPVNVSTQTAVPNQNIDVSVDVKNTGTAVSGSGTVSYYRSTSTPITSANGNTKVGSASFTALAVNRSAPTTVRTTAPGVGTYYYGACIDGTAVCKTGPSVRVSATPAPNLILKDLEVTPRMTEPGKHIDIAVTVENTGTAISSNGGITYYQSGDAIIGSSDRPIVGVDGFNALMPGGRSVESIDITAPTAGGTYYYGACIDGSSVCTEGRRVIVASSVNYVLEDLTVRPSSVQANGNVSIGVTVRNTGSNAALSGSVSYYISTDSVIDASDFRLDGESFGTLNTNAVSNETTYFTASLAPGTYYCGACIDNGSCTTTEVGFSVVHGNSFDTAVNLSVNKIIIDDLRIDDVAEKDYFKFTVSSITILQIYTVGTTDTRLKLYDNSRTELASNDNDNGDINALLAVQISAGTYYFAVAANAVGDYNLVFRDVIDINNPVPFPDLHLESPNASPGNVQRGERITVSVNVENQGGFDSRIGDVRFYESSDAAITSGDRLLERGRYGSLSANGVSTETLEFPAPSAAGAYYYGVCIRGGTCTANGVQVNVSAPSGTELDPFYQWHLNNIFNDVDVNAIEAWSVTEGSDSVIVSVVDDGLIISHPDLAANHMTGYSYNYVTMSDNPDVSADLTDSFHGTAVAGLIAAVKNNGIGVSGVAPGVKFYGLNYLQYPTEANAVLAMLHKKDETAVSNNSWGEPDRLGRILPISSTWRTAITNGITNGYNGKGIFYVFSAGNGRITNDTIADNANYDGTNTHYGVTVVCAVNDKGRVSYYSEHGANLWICGPAGGRNNAGFRDLSTTDALGNEGYNYDPVPGDPNFPPLPLDEYADRDYINTFNGTSGAAPIVSGVAALIRSVDSDLTWRDVRLILAASAAKVDSQDDGWFNGTPSYDGAAYAGPSYKHSHKYGFGLADAKAALDMASNWTNVGSMVTGSGSASDSISIPDNDSNGRISTINVSGLNAALDFIEYVEISISLESEYFGDLLIELTSPTGTKSILAEHHLCFKRQGANYVFISRCYVSDSTPTLFGSARHLGEAPNGNWTLKIADLDSGSTSSISGWSLNFYGHKKP